MAATLAPRERTPPMTYIKLNVGYEPTPEEKAWLEHVEAILNAEYERMEREMAVWGFCFAIHPGIQESTDLWTDAQVARLRGLH